MNTTLKELKQTLSDLLPISLRSANVPERLLVKPVEIWAGCPEKGQALCNGVFSFMGRSIELHGQCWHPEAISVEERAYLHGFEWLRDLRSLGGASARQQAQALIESWIIQHGKPRIHRTGAQHFTPWDLCLTGKRLSLWIAHYDFFAADSDGEFQDMFYASLYKQAEFLLRELRYAHKQNYVQKPQCDYDYLAAMKGMLVCGLAFEGHEDWMHVALDQIMLHCAHMLDEQSMHISRSPYAMLRFLRHVMEIRSALQAGGVPVPQALQNHITQAAANVRFFRYADKRFSLMHGALCGDADYIDAVLAQAAVKPKRVKNLSNSGYTKLSVGRSTLLFDHGHAAQHHAPLSFELSYGKERILTHCGSHEVDEDWRHMLAQPAAHSCLSLSHSNLAAHYKSFDFTHDQNAEYEYVQAAHDGYLSQNGLIHRRSLYLGQDGHDLRGEDCLFAQVPLLQARQAVIRFHVHPKVGVSMLQGGGAALLRLPSGVGWRFKQNGGRLALEESIYCGDGGLHIRKTSQLVIYASAAQDKTSVKWALQREGL